MSDQSSFNELKKYIKSQALKSSAEDTFAQYLGKNSEPVDRKAFLEDLDAEFLANKRHRLSQEFVAKIGVFCLLDGMGNNLPKRTHHLNQLLDEQAYRDGNSDTYDYYLGDRRTGAQEQEFKQKLNYI